MALSIFVIGATALGSCRSKEVAIDFEDGDEHVFSGLERRVIRDIAERAVTDVRATLPGLPQTIQLRVSCGSSVTPETGETASNWQPNGVSFEVDPRRPEGVAAIARTHLRAALFHELHHVVRAAAVDDRRIRDHVMREGLATAFERDFGGASPPWAEYPAEVDRWSREVLSLPDDVPRRPWLFQHPDGRRWIGLRVGTYWADCVMRHSHKTSAELVQVPTDSLLAMCPLP